MNVGRPRPGILSISDQKCRSFKLKKINASTKPRSKIMERPENRGTEQDHDAAERRHRGRPPLGRLGDDGHLHELPHDGEHRMAGEGRPRPVRQLAGGDRRKGERGRRRRGETDPGKAIGLCRALAYAKQNKMKVASPLRNKEGHFVVALTLEATSAAAAVAKSMPEDFRVSLVDTPKGVVAHLRPHLDPRCTRTRRTRPGARPWYSSSSGRSGTARRWRRRWTTPALLPKPVVEKVDKALKQISFKGKSLILTGLFRPEVPIVF